MRVLCFFLPVLFFVYSCGTESTPIYTLTTTVNGEGNINPSRGEYKEGETVTLISIPNNGWLFDSWSGDWGGTTIPLTLTMDGDKHIVGNFIRKEYPLKITIEGEGTVDEQIISQPKSTDYPFETIVQLSPNPSNGWKFIEWTGAINSTDEVIQVPIEGETNITVIFQRIDYPLTITIEGEGTVTEEVVQGKTTDYPYETNVQLTANSAEGWKFVEWSGDRTGGLNPLTITVESEIALTANFTELQLATITTTEPANISVTTAQSGGNITDDGGFAVTARGVVWSTDQNPTVGNNLGSTSDGDGVGSFTSDLTGLSSGTQYYVRSFATNSDGTAYGQEQSFTTTVLEDGEVFNPKTGRIWMDRNLGASRVATSNTDHESYGDLYQWGRAADGHQVVNRFLGDGKTTSGTTSTLSSTDQPGHGDFIIGSTDWRTPQNDNLWQGVNGVNNPCPDGYRLPTDTEWEAEVQSWDSIDAAGAFASPLKLPPLPGLRNRSSGTVGNIDVNGFYWSSTVFSDSRARYLYIDGGTATPESSGQPRAFGFSVRCIKD